MQVKNKKQLLTTLLSVLVSVFLVSAVVYATTTISATRMDVTASGTDSIKAIITEVTSSSTSGSTEGIRAEAIGDAASGSANIRGGNFKANMEAGKTVATLEGILSHASYANGSVTATNIKGATAWVEQGASLTATNLYGMHVHVQTRGDETISGNDVLLALENEAVGGAGREMDSAIKIFDTNVSAKGFGLGIDMTGATMAEVMDATSTMTGTSGLEGIKLTVADSSTAAAYNRGIYVAYTQSGAKTTGAEVQALAADMTLSANVPYAYGLSLYTTSSGNPTVGFMAALSIYMDDPGNATGALVGIDIGLAGGSNTPADRHAFMRMRNHSGGATPDSVFLLEGAAATYLLDIPTASHAPAAYTNYCNADSVNSDGSIKIRIGGTDYYIPYYTLANCAE